MRQSCADCIDQASHALTRRHEQIVPRAALSWTEGRIIGRLMTSANQAPEALFGFYESWERRLNAELFGIGRVDAGHEGLHQALEGFAPQSPPRKRSHAFVALFTPPGHEPLG